MNHETMKNLKSEKVFVEGFLEVVMLSKAIALLETIVLLESTVF